MATALPAIVSAEAKDDPRRRDGIAQELKVSFDLFQFRNALATIPRWSRSSC